MTKTIKKFFSFILMLSILLIAVPFASAQYDACFYYNSCAGVPPAPPPDTGPIVTPASLAMLIPYILTGMMSAGGALALLAIFPIIWLNEYFGASRVAAYQQCLEIELRANYNGPTQCRP